MKKKVSILLSVIIIAGLVIFLTYKPKTGSQVHYYPQRIGRQNIQVITTATGTVEPENRLEIKPPIAGRVDSILVKEGDKIAKNQIIAWMSSTERAALLDAARAKGAKEVAYWEKLYRPTPIISPIDGTVILQSIEAGQTFTSSDAVFTLSNRLTVKAEVDETDIGAIKVGQHASIVLDAYSKQKFPALVTAIAYDATTVNNVTIYEVDVSPIEPIEQMRSGMTANVNFVILEKENVLVVPTSAIQYQDEDTIVLTPMPNKENKIIPQKTVIKTGETNGKYTEIISGLHADDSVLIKGLSENVNQNSSNPLSFGPPKRKKGSSNKSSGRPPQH